MTLTRRKLADAVYATGVDLSRIACSDMVDKVIGEMAVALASGEKAVIMNFGALIVRHVGQRPGRNPKTGVPAIVPAHRAIWFRPSEKLKAKIAKG
jgi:integration host factor subunit alpha